MGTLLKVMQLLPVIFSAVKTAEEFIPLPGQGKAKLDFIISTIQAVAGEVSDLIPAITKVISLVVELFNKTGVFKK